MSYAFVARVLPRGVREGYKSLVQYSGIKMQAERLIGFIVLFGFGIAFAVAFDLMVLFGLDSLLTLAVFAAAYVVLEIGVYMWLWFQAESKAKFVDGILPDALQIMAMNIRSGLTTDRALMLSARPEFGPLEEEIRRAGKDIMAGEDIRSALLRIPKRIKSKILGSTINLLVDSLKSGGDIADLLEQTSADIESTKLINREVTANVLMYVIFIFFAAGVGAPLIFGISTHLVGIMAAQMSKFAAVDLSQFGGMGGFGAFSFSGTSNISVSIDFLILYAVISLAVTSFFGGLIIGLIKDGKEKEGFKYVPLLLCISLVLFFVTRMVATSIFKIL